MIILADRITQLVESQTIRLDTMAKQLMAQGRSIINLTVGELDFETPTAIIDAAHKALDSKYNHYTSTQGFLDVRIAIQEYLQQKYNVEYTPEQIIVTNGAKQALYNCFQTLLNPGDEVIIPVPAWVSYMEQVKLAGGLPITVPTTEDFQLNLEAIAAAITPKTKVIVINYPNNPTGAVYAKQDLEGLANIAREKKVWVISDEIYAQLLYDSQTFLSFGILYPERTILINGFSKAAAMTGWRVGYAAGPQEVVSGMQKLQSHLSGNVSNIAQRAALQALQLPHLSDQFLQSLQERRAAVIDWASHESRITLTLPQGAFFAFINIKKITPDSEAFAERLLNTYGVATVPGKYFNCDGYIRLSFANQIDQLQTGLERFSKCITDYK